ncbi:hypothetical protein CVS47_01599 [Microbacterium lemovicicum]|uniref:Uncharacterized protein n=1 Tax=Microbacterium lemovicicum TaxID=1072463 RepID=A0A3Q9J131_9MICO|nr:hypothetical protein [Microbacterium lemovicicum]AZS36976.1 hypothetical protein CVS47_01599 [Microbacterium lemovicicum]
MRTPLTTPKRTIDAPRELSSPTLDAAEAVITAARRALLTAVTAAPGLWRITGRDGRVIGHIRATGQGATLRYGALRYQPLSRAFRDLGDFWSCEQALDTLRLSR